MCRFTQASVCIRSQQRQPKTQSFLLSRTLSTMAGLPQLGNCLHWYDPTGLFAKNCPSKTQSIRHFPYCTCICSQYVSSLSSLLSRSLRLPLADLLLLRRSLLLERWRDLGFFLFLCLPRVPPWFLERQALAQWFSFWQFRHTDPYARHFFLGCKGWSSPQLGHFFASVLALVLVPFNSMNIFVAFAIQLFHLRLGGFIGPGDVNGLI